MHAGTYELMAKRTRKRKSLDFTRFHPHSIPQGAAALLGLSYREEVEEHLDGLRQVLKHPQSEPGLTVLEFVIRELEKRATAMLKAEGYDTDINELVIWTSDSDMGVKLSSAKGVLIYAWLLRDYIEMKDYNQQALLEMMLLIASAIRAELFEPAIQGILAQQSLELGGEAAGQIRSKAAASRHKLILHQARNLLKEGKAKHDISSILAKRFELSSRQIRSILQKGGILQKKGK